MNAAAFGDIRRIWRVTTVQRDQRGMLLLGWLALVVAVLGEVFAGLVVLRHQGSPLVLLRVLCGVGAFWLGLVWTMVFLPASVVLNSPANARLVPRQRRRLVQMAAASWLLITIGITVATGEWAAFPATGLGLIGFGLVRAGRNEAAPLFLVGVYWQSLSRWVLPPAVVDAVRSNTGLAILSALVVLVGIWALRSVYPAAGDNHLARRAEQLKGAAWWQRDGAANMVEGGRLSQWTVAKVYPRMLQRASRQRRPGMMLMHALGPVAHWSIWIGSLALMFLVCGGVRLLLAWRGREALSHFLDGAMGAGLTAMTMLILFSTAAFSQQIRKTTGEQSLLRLTPLAGDAALLNRRLAVELLKSGLRNWAMLTVAILLATVLLGAGSRIVLFQAALCVLAGQVATFALLGDFAGDGGWNVPRALQAGLLAIAELLLALGLDKLSGMSIWLWLAAISAGTAAWQLRRAWRTMLAAPAAYPAGRTT